MFDPEMIIWVDETGSARRNSVRSYGYSLKGMRAVSHELRVSSQRINAIGAMSTEGMEDVYIVEGNVTGEVLILLNLFEIACYPSWNPLMELIVIQ